jgi:hypothetical protein
MIKKRKIENIVHGVIAWFAKAYALAPIKIAPRIAAAIRNNESKLLIINPPRAARHQIHREFMGVSVCGAATAMSSLKQAEPRGRLCLRVSKPRNFSNPAEELKCHSIYRGDCFWQLGC